MGRKHCRKKEKLPVTSNFSFSNSVSNSVSIRPVLQTRKNQGLFGKGLKELQESMDRLTGRHDITEIALKTALNTTQSINIK